MSKIDLGLYVTLLIIMLTNIWGFMMLSDNLTRIMLRIGKIIKMLEDEAKKKEEGVSTHSKS